MRVRDNVQIILGFDGEEIEVTRFLMADSLSIREQFANESYGSALSGASWMMSLRDEDLFYRMRDWAEKITVRIELCTQVLFDGVMEPVLDMEWNTPDVADPIRCEAVDFTELLDERIMVSLSFPEKVDDPPFYIYRRGYESSSILYQLLDLRGMAHRIADDAPDIEATVVHVSITEDEKTYREVIDALLGDYLYCIAPRADRITWAPISHYDLGHDIEELNEKDIISGDGPGRIRFSKRYEICNGVEVEYPATKVMETALLWRGSLPTGNTADPMPGDPIAAADYWPEDSDILDTWMDFESAYLDTAYLSGQERLRNEAVTLLASSDQEIKDIKDPSIEVDLIEYESLRARLRYKNAGGAAARLYWSEIYGKALVQTARPKISFPEGASNPKPYPSTYIYDSLAAQAAAQARYMMMTAGRWNLSLASPRRLEPGQVVRVRQSLSRWDGYAIVLSRSRQYDASSVWSYELVSTAAVSDLTAIKVGSSVKYGSNPNRLDGQDIFVRNALLKPGTLDEREDFEFKATTGRPSSDGGWDINPEFYIKTGDDYLLAIDDNFLDVADGNLKKRALINGNGDFAITNKRIYLKNVNADGLSAMRANIHGNISTEVLINPALIAQPSSRAITSMQTVRTQAKRLAYDLCSWAQSNGITFNVLHRCEVSEEPDVGWMMFATSTTLGAWGSTEVDCAVYFYGDTGASRYTCWSKSTQVAYQVQNTWIFGWPWFGTHTEYRWETYGTLSGDKQTRYGDAVGRGSGFVVPPVQSIDPSSITIEIPGYGVDLRNSVDVTVGGVVCDGFNTTGGQSMAFRCYFGSDYDLYMKKLPGNDAGTLASLASGAVYKGAGGALYVK